LLDEKGIQINALMAATAWNLKKLMEELKQKVKQFFRLVCIRCFLPEYFSLEGA
jgi:IS5 family transposase